MFLQSKDNSYMLEYLLPVRGDVQSAEVFEMTQPFTAPSVPLVTVTTVTAPHKETLQVVTMVTRLRVVTCTEWWLHGG